MPRHAPTCGARVAVFAGPSLPPHDRLPITGVQYFPPAKRGDVEIAAHEFAAILLIDGAFHHALATTPHEVRRACRSAQIYGAASMGALRAAECRPYGAIPLGAIAHWYACGTIEGDDEVAVLMHPTSFAALTVPSINVRYVARLAIRRRVLNAADAAAWVTAARTRIFYAERSWPAVIDLAPAGAREALHDIARREGDLKRLDAQFALRRMQRLLEHPRAVA